MFLANFAYISTTWCLRDSCHKSLANHGVIVRCRISRGVKKIVKRNLSISWSKFGTKFLIFLFDNKLFLFISIAEKSLKIFLFKIKFISQCFTSLSLLFNSTGSLSLHSLRLFCGKFALFLFFFFN